MSLNASMLLTSTAATTAANWRAFTTHTHSAAAAFAYRNTAKAKHTAKYGECGSCRGSIG